MEPPNVIFYVDKCSPMLSLFDIIFSKWISFKFIVIFSNQMSALLAHGSSSFLADCPFSCFDSTWYKRMRRIHSWYTHFHNSACENEVLDYRHRFLVDPHFSLGHPRRYSLSIIFPFPRPGNCSPLTGDNRHVQYYHWPLLQRVGYGIGDDGKRASQSHDGSDTIHDMGPHLRSALENAEPNKVLTWKSRCCWRDD